MISPSLLDDDQLGQFNNTSFDHSGQGINVRKFRTSHHHTEYLSFQPPSQNIKTLENNVNTSFSRVSTTILLSASILSPRVS